MTDVRPTVRELLLARAGSSAPALVHGERSWTWAEHVEESARRANWLLARPVDGRALHVGILSDNTAEFSFWMGACGLAGVVLVGLNPTRSAPELARDATHAEVDLLLVSEVHEALGRDLAGHLKVGTIQRMGSDSLRAELAAQPTTVPDAEVGPERLFMLIFTSGTTSDPKAVQCSHGRLAHSGSMVGLMAGLSKDDVTLVSMPLFHSNAVIAGWIATLSAGASMVVRNFSARGFVEDLRRHGVTYANYVGKPLTYVMATPHEPGDHDLPLRVVFGNEANEDDIHGFAARFGCRVIDAYGSTEGGISMLRTDETPRGSLGIGIGDIRVLDEEGNECPRAIVGPDGPQNLDEAVGELVNLDGPGGFEGYWRNPKADAERLRRGRFHSGDLAWRDEEGFFWFAGRTGEWLRVDGENLAVAPIERVLVQHDDVLDAAVVAVPDDRVGDQVLACLEVHDLASFDVVAFGDWCARRPDLSVKSLPRFVRVDPALPRTATNKIVRQRLRERGLAGEGPIWFRPPRGTTFEPHRPAQGDDHG